MEQGRIADIIELEQVLARYAVGMTQDDIEAVMEVFTPDGTYSAFGVDLHPEGLSRRSSPPPPRASSSPGPRSSTSTATPAPGYQTLCFVDQTTHDMRIGWYTDTYRRTGQGMAAARRGP